MVLTKNGINTHQNDDMDSDSDSDVSMSTDSEDSYDSDIEMQEDEAIKTSDVSDNEEEDDVIKAIKQERNKPRDHPPIILTEDHIVDISFHPSENLLAVATIVGDVLIYKYTNEENTLVETHELHLKACRDIEFDEDGKVLFSTAKDKAIMLTDVVTGRLIRCYENSHDVPVYCLRVVDENLFASGKYFGYLYGVVINFF